MGRVVEDLRRQQPDPLAHPLDVAVDRDSGRPKQNSSTTDAVFLPMPLIPVSQSRASSAGMSPRNSSEWSPRSSRILRSDAWIRGAFWVASPAGRMTSISSSIGANSTARPVRRRAVLQAAAAPALARVVMLRRETRRVGRAERLERDLGVHVRGVLGEDREDQLARRVEAADPLWVAVDAGELVEREVDEARPVPIEAPLPGDDRIRLPSLPAAWASQPAGGRAGVFSSVIARP